MSFDENVKQYIQKLLKEKETLIARFIEHTGFTPDQINLVERETQNGRIFYPDLKSKYDPPKDIP